MKYLIDANSVIYLVANAFPKLTARVGDTRRGEIGVSAIVFAELMMGVSRGKPPAPEVLDRLIEQMPLLPFDETASRAYGQLPFRRGRFDRLLAGHALALNLTIITTNVSDFSDIAGLRVEDWTRA